MTFKEYAYSFLATVLIIPAVVYPVLCFMEYVARICVNS